jgi:DNA topoisomerase-1
MGKNYKIPASYSPFSLSLEEAVEILTGNAVRSSGIVKQFPEKGIEVRMGRYGLYFTYGGKSYSLPKGTKVEEVTLELCEELLARRQGEGSGKRLVRALRKGQ